MRRSLTLFFGFAFLSFIQISWLNRLSDTTTYNLPIVVLLWTFVLLAPRHRVAAWLGTSLPLDYSSALPFGSYLFSIGLTLIAADFLGRRLPIQRHRLVHFALVGLLSIVAYLLLLLISTTALAARLASWSLLLNVRALAIDLTLFVGLNLIIFFLGTLLTTIVSRLIRRRFLLPHANA